MHEMMYSRETILDITFHSRQQRLPINGERRCVESIVSWPKQNCRGGAQRVAVCSGMSEAPAGFVKSTCDGKKTLAFKRKVRIINIPGRSSLTKNDKESLWYTKDEMDELIDKRCDAMAMMIRDDKATGSSRRGQDENKIAVMRTGSNRRESSSEEGGESYDCIDGLRSPLEYKTCKIVVEESQNEVFLEQEIQWKEDVSDPEHLADVYFEYTRHNQRQASERGRRLALEVEQENTTDYTRTEIEQKKHVNRATGDLNNNREKAISCSSSQQRSLHSFFARTLDETVLEKYASTVSTRKEMPGKEKRRMILEEAIGMVVLSNNPGDGLDTLSSCFSFSHPSSTTSSSQGNSSCNSKWKDDVSGDFTPRPPSRNAPTSCSSRL